MRALGAATNGVLALAVALAPPLVFGLWAWQRALERVDQQLAQSKPLIEQELSAVLERPVHFQKLTPGLDLASIASALQRQTLPVVIEGLELECRPDESRWVGQRWLARAVRVSAQLSPTAIQAGQLNETGVAQVVVESPEAVIYRRPDGRLSVLDFLPKPKTEPDKNAAPFQTIVRLHGGRLRLRDFASLHAPGRLEESALERVEAVADLTGTRTIRFAARAYPTGRTATRFTGPVLVEGSARRGEPGPRDDSPSREQPQFALTASVSELDLPYWLGYAAKPLPQGSVTRGRVSLQASVVVPALPSATPLVRATARFHDLDISVREPVKAPLSGLTGSATFDGETVAAALAGKALGESFTLTGTVGALSSAAPKVVATLTMPKVPLRRGLALLPKLPLPPELALGEGLRLEGAHITGTLTQPQVVARVSGIQASWKGLPPLTASASIAFANQTVQATAVRAELAGGGTLLGSGSYALKTRTGTFQAHLRGAPLEKIALLKNVSVHPRGQVSADVVGTLKGETVTGDGQIQTTNLQLAGLSFPTATARIALQGKRFQLQDGALAGAGGALRVRGSGVLGGALALEGHLVGADLSALAGAFGLPGIAGTASASVQLTGTDAAPVLLLRDVTVLQPRYRFDGHLLTADSASVERATLRLLSTGQVRLELDPMQPLQVTHSPAVARLYGTLTGSKDSAQLNLTASAENIEVEEVLNQVSNEPGHFAPPRLKTTPEYQNLLNELDWTGVPRPPVSGFVRSARATITGDAKDPQIQGDATLGRFLLANFPVEKGALAFSRTPEGLRVHDIQFTTATGSVTGEVALATSGALSGALQAQSIDLEALSSLGGLVEKQVGITGAVSATLTVAGTQERPLLTAQLSAASALEIAGIPVRELTVGAVEIAPDLSGEGGVQGKITLPNASVQLGASGVQLAVSALNYDLGSKRISGGFSITELHFQQLLKDLRGAHLDDTPEGRTFLNQLYQVPNQIDGTVALTGTLSATLGGEGIPKDLAGNFRLRTRELVFQPEGTTEGNPTAASGKKPAAVTGQLSARATLTSERLTLDTAELQLSDPASEEPTILRLLPREERDPKTGETATTKSWLRLPQRKDELLEYHLTLDANALPLNLVRSLSPRSVDLPVQGKVAVTVAADGTLEIPHITASFYADNLLLGQTVGTSGAVNVPPLQIDLLRFQVELTGKNARDWQLSVLDGRLTHAKEVLTFEGALPYDNKDSRVAADRPIQLRAAIDDTAGLTLSTLSQYLQTGGTKLSGVLRGNLQLSGSLNEPALAGKLLLTEGSARFPNPIVRTARDVINPIQHLELAVELAGKEVRFPKAELVMAQLPTVKTEKGKPQPSQPALSTLPSAGSLSLEPGSLIRIENLEDFTRLFVRRDTDASAPAPKLRGEFDLRARFDNFQLDTENASALLMGESLIRAIGGGLEEAAKGQLSGRFLVRGPLLTPTLSTAANSNMRLADLSFRLPERRLPDATTNVERIFNPRFALNLETTSQAKLIKNGVFEFQGLGNVTVSGDLAAPKIEGTLSPTGGIFRYPLAYFIVQRGGELRLTYAKRFEAGQDLIQFDLTAQDVTASAKVLVSGSAVKSSQATPTTFDPGRLSNQIPAELAGRRITVTANFNGLLPLGDITNLQSKAKGNPIRLSSDPPLSEYAIYSLLLPLQMLSGFSEQALRDGVSAVTSGLSSSLLTPLTNQVSKLFGLENVSLDYGQDGLANLFFIRRLPEPLDKVTIEVRRTFQTRSGSTTLLPQLYSINYEIGQLRYGSRLQLGASTNEQRDSQLFIRGTLRY